MWTISDREIVPSRFTPFSPATVLYAFDGPRIFTVYDTDGEQHLACWSDEDERIIRFIVVPTSDRILGDLRRGDLSVFEALNQPRCWLCDVSQTWDLVRCSRVEFQEIPPDALPSPATLLWRHLDEAGGRATQRSQGEERIVAEPQQPSVGLPSDVARLPREAYLAGHRRRSEVAGIVENGVVRLLDTTVKLPEHSRVIVIASEP